MVLGFLTGVVVPRPSLLVTVRGLWQTKVILLLTFVCLVAARVAFFAIVDDPSLLRSSEACVLNFSLVHSLILIKPKLGLIKFKIYFMKLKL